MDRTSGKSIWLPFRPVCSYCLLKTTNMSSLWSNMNHGTEWNWIFKIELQVFLLHWGSRFAKVDGCKFVLKNRVRKFAEPNRVSRDHVIIMCPCRRVGARVWESNQQASFEKKCFNICFCNILCASLCGLIGEHTKKHKSIQINWKRPLLHVLPSSLHTWETMRICY